jgi:hypothetical protein
VQPDRERRADRRAVAGEQARSADLAIDRLDHPRVRQAGEQDVARFRHSTGIRRTLHAALGRQRIDGLRVRIERRQAKARTRQPARDRQAHGAQADEADDAAGFLHRLLPPDAPGP